MSRASTELSDPAEDLILVSPSDSTDLATPSRALIIAVAGNVKLTTVGGTTAVIALPAGQFSIRATRIWSTSTTATGITALI